MIKEIKINDSVSWDEAVKKCPKYDVCCMRHYMKAFQEQGSGEPRLLVFQNGDDYAICSVFLRDVEQSERFNGLIEKEKYYDSSAPYGYGGFVGNVTDWPLLEKEREAWCKENGIICSFERFNLFSDHSKHYSGDVVSHTHNVVRDLELSIDELWMDFKQKVRKNVKRAQKYNLEIVIDENGKYLDDFLKIYYSTMERNDADQRFYFKKSFFETINQMNDNYCYFHVLYHNDEEKKGRIVSTELVIYGSENCYSYLGGTEREYFELRPNDFLKWEIIKWAKEKGLKRFVLGGGYGEDDGIFEYKKCLAPNGVMDFFIGKQIFDKGTYDMLCKMAGIDPSSTDYFPAYRAKYGK